MSTTTTTTTMSYLPNDCVNDILKYLQPYRSALFSCLLVNRFWCKETVPFLYASPFKYFFNKKKPSIISTLILCFSKEEILHLKNQLKLIKINTNIINSIDDEYKPLFEYLKYLENYDCYRVNDAIVDKWLKLEYNKYALRNRVYENIIPIFHKSVLYQCNNIKQLRISLLYLLYHYCTFASDFTKLNSLELDGIDDEIAPRILNDISNTCLNLRKLVISSGDYTTTTTREKLYNVIQKQNNLKAFRLSYCEGLLNDVLLSLEFQKHSLVFIEFSSIKFKNIDFKNFINLCNLKYLKFFDCRDLSLSQCEILKFSLFKLKVLMFMSNQSLNDNVKSLIIKYLGASLNELILMESSTSLLKFSIENILIYCSNLITLKISFGPNIDSLVFPYFKNLKLRSLILIVNNYNNYDMSKDFMNLAKNLSTNVEEVYIWFRYHLQDSLHFNVFLENCHNCLQIIYLNNPLSSIKLDLLKIVLNYTERRNNSLKFFSLADTEKVLKDEESKLLDQIKAKGVKAKIEPYKGFDVDSLNFDRF